MTEYGTKEGGTKMDTYDLMAAKLEQVKREHMNLLNAELFRVGAGPYPIVKPRPWYVRRWWAIKGYLSTLWLALKGVDPYEPGDDY